MRQLITTAAILFATMAGAETPGLREISIPAPHHDRPIDAALWYPAQDGTIRPFGGNAVFVGVPAREGASPTAGQHPLILVSHGLGGNYRSMAWLAAGLAANGAVVVSVNHPASTTFDFDMDKGLNHWTRAEDLSASIDSLLADPSFGPMIDPAQIYAVGFSYGGWTALGLGGLTGDLAAYADHCAQVKERSSHCNDLARAGVDLTTRDAAQWQASTRDPRIRKIAAIDPALTWGLAEKAKTVETPTLLIGLGHGADRLFATDTTDQGSGFAPALLAANPAHRAIEIAPASHFAALLTCTADGAAILEDEGDDPVCSDAKGTNRNQVHGQIVGEIAAFLKL